MTLKNNISEIFRLQNKTKIIAFKVLVLLKLSPVLYYSQNIPSSLVLTGKRSTIVVLI